jgi:methylated-DNA-[protein]-cysteine S-methyltransferase
MHQHSYTTALSNNHKIIGSMEQLSGYIQNELGYICIKADSDKVVSVYFSDIKPETPVSNKIIEECKSQLLEYFSGSRKIFSIPLDLKGTEFQIDVWHELMKIPFGEVITYSKLAHRMGDIKKIRAVGMANGKNPVGIIIPCHRVVGKNGKLVGYGGGLWRKKWLLDFESSRLNLQ